MNLEAQSSVPATQPHSAAQAARYEIDPAHSSAQFAVKHLMVSTVRGEFRNLAGVVQIDDANLEGSRIEATIDAATVNTGVGQRDEHLRSPDFFDTAKYPSISFRSTEVKKVNAGEYRVAGELTMHGVTRPVVLEVESSELEVKDPWGNLKRGAVATTTVNRKDFGLNWNQALEAGGVLVGDKVKITIDLSLARKA